MLLSSSHAACLHWSWGHCLTPSQSLQPSAAACDAACACWSCVGCCWSAPACRFGRSRARRWRTSVLTQAESKQNKSHTLYLGRSRTCAPRSSWWPPGLHQMRAPRSCASGGPLVACETTDCKRDRSVAVNYFNGLYWTNRASGGPAQLGGWC